MVAKELIEKGLKESFKDSNGNMFSLQLKPGLTQAELDEFRRRLPGPIPEEIRELLFFASGFNFPSFRKVDFCPNAMFGLEEILPCGLPLATDECGNEWVLDIRTDTGNWGPVLFMSHDPPVAVVQAPEIATFIEQILDSGRPGSRNKLDYVTNAALDRIWTDDPYSLDVQTARSSSDALLSEFSKQLPETFRVADLRSLEIGTGFCWWRSGRGPKLKRYDSELIFGVESKAKGSFISRLLNRPS